MINCSTKRGKYIVDCTPGTDTIDAISYTVTVNNGSAPIFQGSTKYFGGTYEVDCSDWIESYLADQSDFGITPIHCELYLLFRQYSNGSEHITLGRTIKWYPDTLTLPTPDQMGIYCAGYTGFPGSNVIGYWDGHAEAVSVYPLYFFTMSYKIDGVDYVDDNVMWDPNGVVGKDILLESGESTYFYTVIPNDNSQKDYVKDDVIDEVHPDNVHTYLSSYVRLPRLLFHDGDTVNIIRMEDIYSSYSGMPEIEPIFTANYDSWSDSKKMFGYNGFLRYSKDELDQNYQNEVLSYINMVNSVGTYILLADAAHPENRTMTNIHVELKGYGFKTMMLFNETSGLPGLTDDYCVFTSEYVSCYSTADCPKANIVLFNSDFANTTNTTFMNNKSFNTEQQSSDAPVDIIVPLLIKSGKVVGKTVNNLDKTTYIDRYGDMHNSITTNKYEIECYVDPDWLSVTSGNDLNYEKLMLAIQNAKRSFFCSTAPISGMDCTSEYVMEGRVKDIEKIETYSSYNTNKRVPTYKITFEVYR